MPVLLLQTIRQPHDGEPQFEHDQWITPKGWDMVTAVRAYEDHFPGVTVLTAKFLHSNVLALPVIATPPLRPPNPPRPSPTWPDQLSAALRSAWPLTLALVGLLAVNVVAAIEQQQAPAQRALMEAAR